MIGWLTGTSRAADEAMDRVARTVASDRARAARFAALLSRDRYPRQGIDYSGAMEATYRVAVEEWQRGIERIGRRLRDAAARMERLRNDAATRMERLG